MQIPIYGSEAMARKDAKGAPVYQEQSGVYKGKWSIQNPGQPEPRQQGGSAFRTQQPSRAPDMSAYAQPSGGFNAYSAPQGARSNDLSGQVPANQRWAQAYNEASNQYGGNTQAQSWTMPGSYSSQGYNPATGQYGQPTRGQSWDGNMAYNAIDRRPGPIEATATGIGGNRMPWQQALAQREAFSGNLINLLNEYNSGERTGQPMFDTRQLLSQADAQLARGTFYNPFSQGAAPAGRNAPGQYSPTNQYAPEFQRAMTDSSPYMQGSQWQNPFGEQASMPAPSWQQPSYSPEVYGGPAPRQAPSFPSESNGRRFSGGAFEPERADFDTEDFSRGYSSSPQQQPDYRDAWVAPGPTNRPQPAAPPVARPQPTRQAQLRPEASQGTPYDPTAEPAGLPDVPAEQAPPKKREWKPPAVTRRQVAPVYGLGRQRR